MTASLHREVGQRRSEVADFGWDGKPRQREVSEPRGTLRRNFLGWNCKIRKEVLDSGNNFRSRASRLQTIRPRPTRMQHIPHRLLAFVASLSGIMVTETVDHCIPQWAIVTNQQTFAQRDEYFVNHQPTASKIFGFQI